MTGPGASVGPKFFLQGAVEALGDHYRGVPVLTSPLGT